MIKKKDRCDPQSQRSFDQDQGSNINEEESAP